jgi:tyrosyl-DNA phosphodiesterase 2
MMSPRAATPFAFSRPNSAWLITSRPEPTPPVGLSVLTWNVWFGGYRFDQRRTALISTLAPDVTLLQEVTPELLHAIVREPWVRDAYQVSDATARTLGDYGVLVLSRLAIERIWFLELPTTMGRELLAAELACGLTVATTHLESMGHSASVRAEQLGLIQSALAGARDVLLAGDMNFGPDDPEENAALDATLVDVWPVLHPEDPGFTADSTVNTMRAQVTNKSNHKRIDRMFLRGPTWRARAIELVGTGAIDDAGCFTSDHFGLLARVDP